MFMSDEGPLHVRTLVATLAQSTSLVLIHTESATTLTYVNDFPLHAITLAVNTAPEMDPG